MTQSRRQVVTPRGGILYAEMRMETLDRFTDWLETRWRTVIYSFLAGILFSVACATCSVANELAGKWSLTRPDGYPVLVKSQE